MYDLRNGELAVPDPDNVLFPCLGSGTASSPFRPWITAISRTWATVTGHCHDAAGADTGWAWCPRPAALRNRPKSRVFPVYGLRNGELAVPTSVNSKKTWFQKQDNTQERRLVNGISTNQTLHRLKCPQLICTTRYTRHRYNKQCKHSKTASKSEQGKTSYRNKKKGASRRREQSQTCV